MPTGSMIVQSRLVRQNCMIQTRGMAAEQTSVIRPPSPGLSLRGQSYSTFLASFSWLLLIATATTPAADPLPEVAANRLHVSPAVEKLFLAAPRNSDDLRAMQKHTQKLSVAVTPAVVGIRLKRGMGSGVIISPDGYVLSAGHVTGRANQPATIFLADGRQLSATTLGANHRVDAGLLKIASEHLDGDKPLPFVSIGNSENLKYGQWCFAVGHPGGFREDRLPAVRMGRLLLQGENVIVTDCTLVGGDSGGPLLSATGEVVGIHSRIGEGIEANLHIPVNVFRKDWERFARGDVWGGPSPGGPFLGVLEAENSEEAEIGRVVLGGAAARAGMRKGDVVLKFNDQPIHHFSELVTAVAECDPGQIVRLSVRRNAKNIIVELEVGSFGFD